MVLLRFIGRITLITQGYPHVTVVRIGPGTYGNAGIPYFNMIPQGGYEPFFLVKARMDRNQKEQEVI